MVPRRKAWHTKLYADAARAFAQQQGLALVDLWSAFMNQTNYKPGDHSLPGSKDLPEDPAFKILMHDGKSSKIVDESLLIIRRSTFQRPGLSTFL